MFTKRVVTMFVIFAISMITGIAATPYSLRVAEYATLLAVVIVLSATAEICFRVGRCIWQDGARRIGTPILEGLIGSFFIVAALVCVLGIPYAICTW